MFEVYMNNLKYLKDKYYLVTSLNHIAHESLFKILAGYADRNDYSLGYSLSLRHTSTPSSKCMDKFLNFRRWNHFLVYPINYIYQPCDLSKDGTRIDR